MTTVVSGAFVVTVVVVSGFFVSLGAVVVVVSGAYVVETGVVSAIEELLPPSAEQPPTSKTAAKTANEIAICFFFIIYPSFLNKALDYILF